MGLDLLNKLLLIKAPRIMRGKDLFEQFQKGHTVWELTKAGLTNSVTGYRTYRIYLISKLIGELLLYPLKNLKIRYSEKEGWSLKWKRKRKNH